MSEQEMLIWIKQISLNLRFYRKYNGLNQKKLAEKAGVNYRYYQDIETAKVNPTMETLLKLCHALDVVIDDVITSNMVFFEGELDDLIEVLHQDFNKFDFRLLLRNHMGQVIFTNDFFRFQAKADPANNKFTDLISKSFADATTEIIEGEKRGRTATYFTTGNPDIYRSQRIVCRPFIIFHKKTFNYLGAATIVVPEFSNISLAMQAFRNLIQEKILNS